MAPLPPSDSVSAPAHVDAWADSRAGRQVYLYMSDVPSALRSLAIVLVRPESPGNVGAVARVIRNFGLGPLLIVGEPIHEQAEAERLAHRSVSVLRAAQVFPDLTSALQGAQWVVGTSGRMRQKGPRGEPIRGVASRIVHRAQMGRGAIVFGPESDGLTLHDIARCDEVVRIPQRVDAPALNLAQAVAVIGSELFQAALTPGMCGPPIVDRATRIRVADRMTRIARHCGLPVRNRPEEFAETLRGVLARHEYSPHELAVFECWLTQIEWFVGLSEAAPSGGACDG